MAAVRQVRRNIDRVRKLLLDPTPFSVESCAHPMQQAVDGLAALEAALRSTRAPESDRKLMQAEVMQLRNDMCRVRQLLDSAGRYYSQWADFLTRVNGTEDTTQYASSGETVPASAVHKIMVIG